MTEHLVTSAPAPVEYPERDGKPMAETDRHRRVLNALVEALDDYYREVPDVYVSGNLLLYYEEGNPAASVAPDVFVVRGIPKRERRIYRLWDEGKAPDVVLEVTSRSTRLEDFGTKRALYAWLGVREYFQYDPLREYLDPPLQGYRLADGEYVRIVPEESGALRSEALGLELRLEDADLRLVDPATGERLLTPAEAQQARRTEARAREVEAQARRAAETRAAESEGRAAELAARAAALEAELARLRSERATHGAEPASDPGPS